MKTLSPTLALLSLTLCVAVIGCDTEPHDSGPADADADATDRGPMNGKADAIGSCTPDDCGGQASAGSCWCDDECAEYGDCCADIEPVCGAGDDNGAGEPAGALCNFAEGCAQGNYCAVTGDSAAGVCHSTDELVDAALENLQINHPRAGVTDRAGAVVSRVVTQSLGNVQLHSSLYAVELRGSEDNLARVQFDIGGEFLNVWREVPEDTRATAPWGDAQYVAPGSVQMTVDTEISFETLYENLRSATGEALTIEGLERSGDGELWFFNLNVPGFMELELATKLSEGEHVVEAWPNRIILLSHGDAVDVGGVIAEY